MLAIVVRATRAGAQFVIATHSPVLLAIPGARVFELGDDGVTETAYDDLETERFTRGFLEASERYLRAALEDDYTAGRSGSTTRRRRERRGSSRRA